MREQGLAHDPQARKDRPQSVIRYCRGSLEEVENLRAKRVGMWKRGRGFGKLVDVGACAAAVWFHAS